MVTSGHPVLPGLLEFALAYLLVLALPGANFLLVAQASATASLRKALATALGIGFGATLLAAVALSGASLMSGDPRLVIAAKLLLSGILVTIGIGALRRAWAADGERKPGRGTGCGGHVCLGIVAAATNPVTAAFFVGAAASAGLGQAGGGSWLAVATVFLVATTWFGGIALAFSHREFRGLYGRARRSVDIGVGSVLAGLGVLTALRAILA